MSQVLRTLKQVDDTASECGINLNDRVDRCDDFHPYHGGYTIVYNGTLRPHGEIVAIKSLRLSPLPEKVAVDHIITNVYHWSQLDHPNIVRIFGVLTKFDYSVSIICAWIPRGNAFDYVQNKDVDPRPLILEIARGLEYLHNQKLLHGDLRGKNVLISEDGHALLADFGLLLLIENAFSLTAAAPIHPTVRWLSPEQITNDGKATTQSDVWSFGMTALELFTRIPPYHDVRDTRGIILAIIQGPPSRPSKKSTCSRMTDPWWEVCNMCWERNESSRSSISDIVNKIGAIGPEAVPDRQGVLMFTYEMFARSFGALAFYFRS